MDINKKICKKCGRKRKLGKFGVLSAKSDGKNIYCKDCMKEFNGSYTSTPIGIIKKKKTIKKWKEKNKKRISLFLI